MTKDEALKLALEIMHNQGDVGVDEWRAAEAAIKEALAQPDAFEQGRQEGMKQERALWELSRVGQEIEAQPARTGWPEGLLQDDDRKLSKWLASKPDAKHVVDMAQETKIGCVQHDCAECKTRTAQQDAHKSMVEAASQQRSWVGLTEIDVLAESKHWRNPEDFLDGVYWAETTLKEKNT